MHSMFSVMAGMTVRLVHNKKKAIHESEKKNKGKKKTEKAARDLNLDLFE